MTSILLILRYGVLTAWTAVCAGMADPGSVAVSGLCFAWQGKGWGEGRPSPHQPSPGGRGKESRAQPASFVQSRGLMFFSLAYAAADSSIIGRTMLWSDSIQSVMTFHFL